MVNNLCHTEVEQNLLSIFKDLLGISINTQQYDIIFFDEKINLSARDVIQLIYAIEKKYYIKFSENKLSNINMYTFNMILKEVVDLLN